MTNHGIERVAEQHYFFRKQLDAALEKFVIAPASREICAGSVTYAEWWRASHADKFFDMSTLVRAGAAVEDLLRDAYMRRKGYASRAALFGDASYKRGIFQRIAPPSDDAVRNMFRAVGIELDAYPQWRTIQELMLDRHLYAHSLGVLDHHYIEQVKALIGVDLAADPRVANDFPSNDLYWFEPLKRIPVYIEEVRKLGRWLADA